MLHLDISRSVAVVLLAGLISILCCQQSVSASSSVSHFGVLQEKLAADGFDKGKLKLLYNHPKVTFETKRVYSFSTHNEAKLNYDQFLSRRSLSKAGQYMKTHQTDLANAEKTYDVEKEIITAILLVETRLGTYLGKSLIFNTLSTIAALSDPDVRDFLWEEIDGDTKGNRKQFDTWADRKSAWAYDELKAFLTFTRKYDISPIDIMGSYAGAMGICQFMPSNALTLAKDGNNDGKVDLFNHADAIASVANFLKTHDWKSGLNRDQKYKILLQYNYSKYYANILLKIANRL